MLKKYPSLKVVYSPEYKKKPEKKCPYCVTIENILGEDAGSVSNKHLFISGGKITCPRIT
jgi:hypothetical protein